MKVYFSQIYIKPGVNFPFSHQFQAHLSEAITGLVKLSAQFAYKYGDDFNVIFRISAKKEIRNNELKGPTVFDKEKDVEYTVFLPFDVIQRTSDVNRSALEFLLDGVALALTSLDIGVDKLSQERAHLIERVLSDPTMFKKRTSI